MIRKGRHHVTEDWEPRNSDQKYRGMVTLKKALANSINTISAKLIDKTGPEAVVELTKKLGVDVYKRQVLKYALKMDVKNFIEILKNLP